MAFTSLKLPVQRKQHFSFFASGELTNDTMQESLNPNSVNSDIFDYELIDVRLHLSVVHASVVDFFTYVSHHIQSVYNLLLVSAPMLGAQNIHYIPENRLIFKASDTINFSLVMSSANSYGLVATIWSITGG